jgi:hypothetical protein
MNPFCKGGAMKTLSKPRFSSKSGVSCYNHPSFFGEGLKPTDTSLKYCGTAEKLIV